MKKLISLFLILLFSFTFLGCGEKPEPEPEGDPALEGEPGEPANPTTPPKEDEPLIDLSEYLIDIESLTGYVGNAASYIFSSDNASLIEYVVEVLSKVNFTELLTAKNRDDDSPFTDLINEKVLTLNRSNGDKIAFTVTSLGNLYVEYKKFEDGKYLTTWSYKAINPIEILTIVKLTPSTLSNLPIWCMDPPVTDYIENLESAIQDEIIKIYINKISPLKEYFTEGEKFSGFIKQFFGKFGDYYAVIVGGCGMEYVQSLWTDVVGGINFNYLDGNQILLIGLNKCLTLKEAFEENIISLDDLKAISEKLDIMNKFID